MPFLTFLLTYLGTFLLGELLRPKPRLENAKPAGLGDFSVPTATEGRVVPIIWGRVLLKGTNVVWYGDLGNDPITQKVKTGLFSSERQTIGFRYKIGLQMALCRGNPGSEAPTLRNIRIDESAAWGADASTADAAIVPVDAGSVYTINQPEFFGGEDAGGGGGIIGSGRVYPGTETQAVSAYLTPFQSPQPAYRGTYYLTWDQGEIGLSPQLRPWEFEIERYPDGLDLASLQPGDEIVDEGANPMNVIYEALTDDEWGLKQAAVTVNVVSLRASAAIMKVEGQGFAFIWDRTLDVKEIISTIEEQVDGILIQDPATGVYDFKLIRFDYIPANLEVLDNTNTREITRFARPSWDETQNYLTAEFVDRRKNYNTSFALAQDMANVDIVGASNKSTIRFPGVKSAALANSLAWREIRQLSFPAATGASVVDRSQHDIVPGDVRALTWPRLGISALPIRITKVDRGDLLNNRIQIDWTQDIFAFNPGSFSDPIDTGWIPPNVDPQAALYERLWEIPFQMSPTAETYVAALGSRDGSEHLSYDVVTDLAGGITYVLTANNRLWTPVGLLQGALDKDLNGPPHYQTTIVVDNLNDATTAAIAALADATVNPVDPQNVILINDELMWFQAAVDNLDGTVDLTVNRGSFDTIPVDHIDNSEVWFIGVEAALLRDTPLPAGLGAITAKILPTTISGTFAEGLAAQLALTTIDRFDGAIPPNNPDLNGNLFVDENWNSLTNPVTLTWLRRNRTTQSFDTLQDDADITPEAGTTYDFEARRVSDDVLVDSGSLTGTSVVINNMLSAIAYYVLFKAVRNGVDSQEWRSNDFTMT